MGLQYGLINLTLWSLNMAHDPINLLNQLSNAGFSVAMEEEIALQLYEVKYKIAAKEHVAAGKDFNNWVELNAGYGEFWMDLADSLGIDISEGEPLALSIIHNRVEKEIFGKTIDEVL